MKCSCSGLPRPVPAPTMDSGKRRRAAPGPFTAGHAVSQQRPIVRSAWERDFVTLIRGLAQGCLDGDFIGKNCILFSLLRIFPPDWEGEGEREREEGGGVRWRNGFVRVPGVFRRASPPILRPVNQEHTARPNGTPAEKSPGKPGGTRPEPRNRPADTTRYKEKSPGTAKNGATSFRDGPSETRREPGPPVRSGQLFPPCYKPFREAREGAGAAVPEIFLPAFG